VKNNLRKALILENTLPSIPSIPSIPQVQEHVSKIPNQVSAHGNNFVVNNLPLEKLVDIEDEKEIIQGLGGEKRYVANQANNYKLLGGIGGASAGIKGGLETGELFDASDDASLPLNIAGGTLGFLGGGYLGSKFGKDYGSTLAQKTYDKIYNKNEGEK